MGGNYMDKTEVIKNNDEINTLYVFDKELVKTGSIEDIAPGERIYSARFDGEVGYFGEEIAAACGMSPVGVQGTLNSLVKRYVLSLYTIIITFIFYFVNTFL